MKNLILIHLIAAVFISCLISCADDNKDNPDKSLAESKEKKETKLNKPKKKDKKKTGLLNKKKDESYASATPAKEAETPSTAENTRMVVQLADQINEYAALNGYSTKICFLVDMTLPGGRNRFFVYDAEKKSVVATALVAHGCCNQSFLSRPKFSNAPDCGCTSLGRYKVGEFFHGTYGKSFRLYGLDNSNSNAFKRGVVIHGQDCVPDEEIFPRVLCNSFGCVMVSNNFFARLSKIIKGSDKPIVLWVYG